MNTAPLYCLHEDYFAKIGGADSGIVAVMFFQVLETQTKF